MEKKGVAHLVLIVVLVVVAAVLVVSLTGNIVLKEDVRKCYDTDVNDKFPDGRNYVETGNVRYGDFRENSYQDHCIDSETLIEYFCNGDDVESVEFGCKYGCATEKGRCKQKI
jgi:hypothetical protein